MQFTRREMLATTVTAALAASVTRPALADDNFDINAAFETFMADLSRSSGDGSVTFTGRDPILHSRFRIGTSMAPAAMVTAVDVAAIRHERNGDGQDVAVGIGDAVLNVNPAIDLVVQRRIALGADDPVASALTWFPTANGKLVQALVGLGNPFSFVPFLTKDRRHVNITGIYSELQNRALTLLKA